MSLSSPAKTLFLRQRAVNPDMTRLRCVVAAFRPAGIVLILILMLCAAREELVAQAQTPVTTWHYNNARTGANTTETILTPANVKYQTFGKLWSKPTDGLMVGHPLYLPNVTIPGKGTYNVLFAATMHDSVYAFDADSADPAPLWMTSLLPAGAATMSTTLKKNASTVGWTEMGIVSTPVIDSTAGLIYVVAESYENSNVVHRLHALDVTTGQERLGGPITITATSVQNGISTTFQDFYQMNRPALLLANGHIYIAWGSNCCNVEPTQGWVFSYNATTLAQEGAYTDEPGQNLASIWMEGAGLSADSDGNIYGENGEGYYAPGINLSTSVLKLSQVGTTLSLSDWFTPFIHQFLSMDDLDLTGGVVLLPDQPGNVPHEAIAIGKQGTIYVLNRDMGMLGQLCSNCTTSDSQIVQELQLAVPESGTPVYWNNMLYFAGLGVPVVAYPLSNGQLGTPLVAPSVRGAGANPILTANGNSNGILWFLDGNYNLWGLDATSLTTLYASGQAPNNRDKLPVLAHFASPIAADGKVFVGTVNSVVGFGILPTISLSAGGGQSAVEGTTLPIPLQVQIVDPDTHAGVSGVSVGFSDGGKGGVLNPATAVTDANGFASTSYTLPATIGTFTITASATGYATLSFTEASLAKKVSKTTLVSNANPASLGQSVTFTATVTSAGGSIPNGETVTFKNGATVMGTGSLNNGVTTLTTSALAAGTSSITANYPGDNTFAASSGIVSEVVKGSSTTTVSSSLNPSNAGQSVTFTAQVTSTSGSIPDGEIITFKNGTTVLGASSLSSGTAAFTTSTLPAGTDSIAAVYPGDSGFRSSYATVSQKVTKFSTATSLHSASNPASVGQAVTFTATVTSASGGIPDGEAVTFKSGSTVLGTGGLTSGVATFTISSLPAGANSITAAYGGDANFAGSSSALVETVKNITTTTITSNVNPSAVGQAVTFTAQVTSTGGTVPNGETVSFKSGSTVIGSGTLSGGAATFTTSTLPAGTSSILATYPGDTAFRSSFSNLLQKVQ